MRILCQEFLFWLTRCYQGPIELLGVLLNYPQQLNFWYIFYTNPTLNNGLNTTYVASCSSSVGNVANVLGGRGAVTSFTSMAPPPQQCCGRWKGGQEVANKLRTRASAVACTFLCVQAGVFFATRCGSFLLTHRDSNGLNATYVASCSSSVGDVANVLEGEWL